MLKEKAMSVVSLTFDSVDSRLGRSLGSSSILVESLVERSRFIPSWLRLARVGTARLHGRDERAFLSSV